MMNCNGLAVFADFGRKWHLELKRRTSTNLMSSISFLKSKKIPPCNKNKRIERMQLPGYNKNTNREK